MSTASTLCSPAGAVSRRSRCNGSSTRSPTAITSLTATMQRCAAAIALLVLLLGVSCGGDDAPDPAATAGGSQLRGDLNVFAAASLTEAFSDEKATLKTKAPDLSLTFNFAGSQGL